MVFCLLLAKPFWLSVCCETQERSFLSWRCTELISRKAFGVGNILDISLHLHLRVPSFFDAAKRVTFSCQLHSLSILAHGAGVAFYKPPIPGRGILNQPCSAQGLQCRSVVLGAMGCLRVPCLGRGACHLMRKPPPPLKQHLHYRNSA